MTASNSTNVAQANRISGFSKAVTYNISDTSANLAGANSEALKQAVAVTATDVATVAQATTIKNGGNSGATTYSITDTAAAIAGASQAVLDGAQNLLKQ